MYQNVDILLFHTSIVLPTQLQNSKGVEQSEFELVEALAEKICAIIIEEFKVPWVKLTLSKPGAVKGSRAVGVIIERGKKPV